MTEEQLNKNRWNDRIINLVTSVIIILIGGWVTGFTDFRDKSASKEYVDKQIKYHEAKEAEVYSRLEKIIMLSFEKQEAVVSSIDKRLERIENREL